MPVSQKASYMLGTPSWYGRRHDPTYMSDKLLQMPFTSDYDSVNHRLFVGDQGRILVFDVAPGKLHDYMAASVVLQGPTTFVVDSKNQRMFWADMRENRVKVLDIRPEVFTAESKSIAILGQPDTTSTAPGLGPDRMNRPTYMAYDENNDRLFVGERGNNRILVFDTKELSTGEAAIDVLGQADFQSREKYDVWDFSKIKAASMGMTYDPVTDRLFVTAGTGIVDNRVLVFDVSPDRMTNFPEPLAVIGKPGFENYDPVVDESNMVWPFLSPKAIDSENQMLIMTEGHGGGNRVAFYDIHPGHLKKTGNKVLAILGNIDDDGEVSATRRLVNDRANNMYIYPRDAALDPVHHRLFVTDQYQERLLVFPLDARNRILNYRANVVIGQPDFYTADMRPTSSRTLKTPFEVAYDDVHERLFAVDSWGNRILVFDAHPDRLKNYPEAIAVIGQNDFTSVDIGTSRRAINLGLKVTGIGITPGSPRGIGMSLDRDNQRLFVSEGGNARVTVFDVNPDKLKNYPAAIAVLGYSDFTSNPDTVRAGFNVAKAQVEVNASTFNIPGGQTYDHNHQRLFVSDGRNHRVLVFDAHPDRLTNGAVAIAVIGQPDFKSNKPGRSANQFDGPDDLVYDHAKDRLYVSDHENDRVMVFDVDPHRLHNGPKALAEFGQQDFGIHERGPGGPQQIWDPRGLEFDEKHQRLYQTQGFSTSMMVWDMPRAQWDVDVLPRSTLRFQSLGVREYGSAETKFDRAGYAVIDGENLAVTASFVVSKEIYDAEGSLRTSKITISQASAALMQPTKQVMIFADQRRGHDTLLSLVNTDKRRANVVLTLRDEKGQTIAEISRSVKANTQIQVKLSELGGEAETGTVSISSNRPVSVAALGSIENVRKEQILTTLPQSTGRQDPRSSYAIAGLRDGGGYQSEVVLINDNSSVAQGWLNYYSALGEARGIAEYNIPAGGVFVWKTPGHDQVTENGFVVVEVSNGQAPAGGGMVSYRKGGLLISAHAAIAAPVDLSREAQLLWFPLHTLPDMVRHGEQHHYVTIANPEKRRPVIVRFYLFDAFGKEQGRHEMLLPPMMQRRFDLAQVFNQTQFSKHSVKILTDLPVAIHSHQETLNIRDELVSTEVVGLHESWMTAGMRVLPHFLDQAGFATDINLINAKKENINGMITFYTPEGEEMSVTLR